MAKAATWILGALLLTALVAMPALAAQYPPTCPDSISIWNIQNPAAPCHPTDGDTVWVGIGGVVTGRDTKTSGVGFYMQLSGGGPWSGIDVFTANTIWPVAVGDSVIVRPSKVMEYGGETEVVSLTGSFGSNLYVYKGPRSDRPSRRSTRGTRPTSTTCRATPPSSRTNAASPRSSARRTPARGAAVRHDPGLLVHGRGQRLHDGHLRQRVRGHPHPPEPQPGRAAPRDHAFVDPGHRGPDARLATASACGTTTTGILR